MLPPPSGTHAPPPTHSPSHPPSHPPTSQSGSHMLPAAMPCVDQQRSSPRMLLRLVHAACSPRRVLGVMMGLVDAWVCCLIDQPWLPCLTLKPESQVSTGDGAGREARRSLRSCRRKLIAVVHAQQQDARVAWPSHIRLFGLRSSPRAAASGLHRNRRCADVQHLVAPLWPPASDPSPRTWQSIGAAGPARSCTFGCASVPPCRVRRQGRRIGCRPAARHLQLQSPSARPPAAQAGASPATGSSPNVLGGSCCVSCRADAAGLCGSIWQCRWPRARARCAWQAKCVHPCIARARHG